MERTLIISDLHDETEALISILNDVEDFDLLILAGDICEFRCKEIIPIIDSVEADVVFVPGNHDCISCWEKAKKVRILKADVADVGGVIIAGLGGVYSEKREDWHHYTDGTILKLLSKVGEADVLVTHEPLYGICDRIPGGGRGGKRHLWVLYEYLRPGLIISGHTHLPCVDFLPEVAVNPGLSASGLYALVSGKEVSILWSGYKMSASEWRLITYAYNEVRRLREYYKLMSLAAGIDVEESVFAEARVEAEGGSGIRGSKRRRGVQDSP